MLQRIQTIYLLLASGFTITAFFLDWVVYTDDLGSVALTPFSSDGVSNATLTFLNALLLGLLVAAIIQYKNRKRQMNNVKMAIAASLLTLAGFALDHYLNIGAMNGKDVTMAYGLAVVFPLITAVLTWMALRAIKKDEDLVRSVDRLR